MLAEIKFEDYDGSPVAKVRGEIDMSNVYELSQSMQKAVDQSAAGLVIDFSQTDYLDSAGVQLLFDLGKRLRDRGQKLVLAVPTTSPVAGVLDIVHVETLAGRCETLDQAVERLRAHAGDVPPSAQAG